MSVEFPPPPQGASNVVRTGGFKQWFLDVWGSLAVIRDLLTGLQAQTAALGTWVAYTPVIGGITIGTTGSSLVGRYTKIGTTVTCDVLIVLGTGGSMGTLVVGLPFTARAGYSIGVAGANTVGVWGATDASASGNAARQGGRVALNTTSQVRFWGTAGEPLNGTWPWTWAAGDAVEMQFTYEAAA